MGLVLELHHDDAEVNLPGVADLLAEVVKPVLVVLVQEEAAFQELALVRTEDVFDSIWTPVILVDTVEILNVGADVLCKCVSGVLVGRLEGSDAPKVRVLNLG